jgi:hypothetical protein
LGPWGISLLGTASIVAGIALLASGTAVPGLILLLVGLLLYALALATVLVRRAIGAIGKARDLYEFVRAGHPQEARIVRLQPPTSVLSPNLEVELEMTNPAGTRSVSHEIGVPRMYAALYLISRRLPVIGRLVPSGLDDIRVQLQRQANEAVVEPVTPAA